MHILSVLPYYYWFFFKNTLHFSTTSLSAFWLACPLRQESLRNKMTDHVLLWKRTSCPVEYTPIPWTQYSCHCFILPGYSEENEYCETVQQQERNRRTGWLQEHASGTNELNSQAVQWIHLWTVPHKKKTQRSLQLQAERLKLERWEPQLRCSLTHVCIQDPKARKRSHPQTAWPAAVRKRKGWTAQSRIWVAGSQKTWWERCRCYIWC